MADDRHYADEGLGLLEGEFTGDHNVEDPELEAIKARVREMEEEAEKLKEVQYETEKHLIMSPQASGKSDTPPLPVKIPNYQRRCGNIILEVGCKTLS
ncbi:polyadenylate-binding protein 2-like [Polyodon spathula]|uniref:polyadenylate-binding protein 2-like n=1 Tax=Polyodon spathula TaxID=7913 RepID=UPI001B7E49AD|nr:polyadenylate-binding protein 2-like [Polyodon spathula]